MHRPDSTRPRRGWRTVIASLALAGAGLAAPSVATAAPAPTHAAPSVAGTHTARVGARDVNPNKPAGDSGTTIDPLQYGCQIDNPACGNNANNRGGVGESYSYYNGNAVDILYSENWYCDSTVSAASGTGCEVGAPPSASPSPMSSGGTGTSLGNTTHGDTLYIPVPLFSTPPPPPTQCPAGSATVVCIDHPKNVDLSRLGGAFAADTNVSIPAHNHVVGTRNNGNPEWWNVQVIATTSAATFASLTSVSAIQAAVANGTAISAPSNIYLFFQVLPGTVPLSVAQDPANLTTFAAPPGVSYGAAPAPTAPNQAETGSTFNNLNYDCQQTAPNCEGVGIAHAWVSGTPGVGTGQDAQLLYSEQYQCIGNSKAGAAPCEVGQPATGVPAGVSDSTVPTAANSAPGATGNGQIDPLYIPVPIGFTPDYAQCPGAITCIDHPMTVDLSTIAPYLPGHPSPASLTNVPLPSHDHVIRTRNQDAPEWWNVEVVPVTSQAQLTAIENAKNLSVRQETPFDPNANPGGAIDTNVYLWFQALPGQAVTTPGPTQPAACMAHLPAGQVAAGAAVPDGTGYLEVDKAGDVAVFGGTTCYGSLTGVHLNAPIVGAAVDRTTGGYWLVASDGGVFAFNAPFLGSRGGQPLNKPIVGISTDLNGQGYYLVASDGGIFAYNEPFLGSRGGQSLNAPVVGMATAPKGGYWLVASDGGIFAYGGAQFYGSRGGQPLNQPVVGMTTLSDGSGYRLVASDGGIFSYNAPFYGSTGNLHLNSPVIAAANDNGTDGYWLFAGDGGVFTYGYPTGGGAIDTPFYGSAA